MKGPQFVQYFIPVLEALKELGGSGRPSEVKDNIASKIQLSKSAYQQTKNGETRFSNQVAWARFYLVKAEYIDASTRGVWSLTEKGLNSQLNFEDTIEIFKQVQARFNRNNDISDLDETEVKNQTLFTEVLEVPIDFSDSSISVSSPEESHREKLLTTLKTLSSSGFERLCQRILREAGFEKVEVTGRTGDGGIDGNGLLRINPFVTFRVAFQCKRYDRSVGTEVIRDFRGSVMGRAEKGIVLTTGIFTQAAITEASRDGALPIELVDGEKLMSMLETLELGIKPRTVIVYDIDQSFFDEFTN